MKNRLLYYGLWSAGLLLTEIVLFFGSCPAFVRDYMGGALLILLMYCMIRVFTERFPRLLPFLVCCIGFAVEGLQYVFYELLGLGRDSLLAVLTGASASWGDAVSYFVGMLLVYSVLWLRSGENAGMKSKKRRLLYYGLWTAGLFITEIIIGTWLNDWHFVRNYMGDVLVIPLIYCVLRLFTEKWPKLLPFFVCCIGFLAEGLQYVRFYAWLGFEKNSLPAIILGTGFSWADMLCYIVGMLLIYGVLWMRSAMVVRKKVN